MPNSYAIWFVGSVQLAWNDFCQSSDLQCHGVSQKPSDIKEIHLENDRLPIHMFQGFNGTFWVRYLVRIKFLLVDCQ